MDWGDSRGAIVAVFQTLVWIGNALWAGAMLAVLNRNMHARGTRRRYIWSSVYRPLQLAGPVVSIIALVKDFLTEQSTFTRSVDVFVLVFTIWVYYIFKKDDDDFWTGFGGRLKRRLGSLLSSGRRQVAFDA